MKIKLWKSTLCSVLLIQHLHKFNFKSSCSKCGYSVPHCTTFTLEYMSSVDSCGTQWCQFVWRTAFIHQGSAALIMPGCRGGRVDGKKKKSEQVSVEEKKTKMALKTLSSWRLFCEKEHGLALPNLFLMSLRSSSTVCLFSSLPPLLTHPPFISFKSVICILR